MMMMKMVAIINMIKTMIMTMKMILTTVLTCLPMCILLFFTLMNGGKKLKSKPQDFITTNVEVTGMT